MARKVFISVDINQDERIVALAKEDRMMALLWKDFILLFDDWGRANASALKIKAAMFGGFDWMTEEYIEECITTYARLGLMDLYYVKGRRFMFIAPQKWYEYQPHIKQAQRAHPERSKCPDPALANPDGATNRDCGEAVADYRDKSRFVANNQASVSDSVSDSHPSSPLEGDGVLGLGAEDAEAPGQDPAPLTESETEEGDPLDSDHEDAEKEIFSYPAEFIGFWEAYPRKIAKRAALRAWRRIRGRPPLARIIAAIEAAKCSEQWRRDGGQFIPYPASWLNAGCWDDEVLPPGGAAAPSIPSAPRPVQTMTYEQKAAEAALRRQAEQQRQAA